ncbi:STAS domain-containing protein [Pseudonocardia xinjiangensis]|uniref:STAS domain-containing protein n=1 Tax=Pseudonocardia xinjiangensis TaxID=75289 RepID=A0ABX1RBK6_9PSEU|nr:STAS domain-containing protein [Pseudonocardia xinjiangensis]NMH76511.1 STAS domain-containing protein [Pseudonocardia xinjiangensis]
MSGNRRDALATVGHHALLAASDRHRRTEIDTWLLAAHSRGEKVLTLAAPDGFDAGVHRSGAGPVVLDPADLRPAAEPARLVLHALDEGYRGLGVVMWADGVVAASSNEMYSDVEAVLGDLSRNHQVSVLCLYDRAAGMDHLDLAVTGHPDGLHEQQLDVRRREATLHLGGEIDMTNLDVLAVALRSLTRTAGRTVRIDLGGLRFLGVSGVRLLHLETAAFRAAGGQVELHGAAPHLTRVLRLLQLDQLPGLTLVPGRS